MSPTYFVFGSAAVKSRPIRSGAFAAAGSVTVVRCLRRSRTPARPMLRITRAMRLEAGAGDAENGAQPLHAVTALVVGDELEAVHQRVSPAKYFVAFRRISRSSSSSRTFLRSAAFSASSGVGG